MRNDIGTVAALLLARVNAPEGEIYRVSLEIVEALRGGIPEEMLVDAYIRGFERGVENRDDLEFSRRHIAKAARDYADKALCRHISRWEDISSAPQTGAQVDLWCRHPGLSGGSYGRVPDCWFSSGSWWRYDETGDDQCRSRVHNATHWMLRPEPPGSDDRTIASPESDGGLNKNAQ